MSGWIDFKELREKLKFEDVLAHFNVEIRQKGTGTQHMGYCPLPSHAGKRKSVSFSANLEKGIFHCFGCQAQGNLLDFAVLMAGGDPKKGADVRKAALALQSKFSVTTERKPPPAKKPKTETVDPGQKQLELEVVVNAPLDFELKGLDRSHPYLPGRGFAPETIAHFGLGYCARGSLSGRIAIPLHDAAGRLIGYAGRVVDDEAITEDNPRYRLPASREKDGRSLEFRKSVFLYNGFRFAAPLPSLVVVEGFPSVWWLTQHGFPHVVSTLGAECSEEQAALIVGLVKPDGHVWVIPDGDKAGERFGQSLLMQISPHRFVRWVKLGEGEQPTDLTPAALKERFTV